MMQCATSIPFEKAAERTTVAKAAAKKVKIVYHGKEEKQFGGVKVPEYSMTNTTTLGLTSTSGFAGLAEDDAETSDDSSVTSETSNTGITPRKTNIEMTLAPALQPKFQILGSFSPEAEIEADRDSNGKITPVGSRLTTPRIRKV